MSPKLTFTICSAVSFLFSISFYVFAEFFTKITFPQAEGYAIELGNAMRYVLAASIFLASSMLFYLRNLTGESNQKSVLFGTSLGFAVVCITLLTYIQLEQSMQNLQLFQQGFCRFFVSFIKAN